MHGKGIWIVQRRRRSSVSAFSLSNVHEDLNPCVYVPVPPTQSFVCAFWFWRCPVRIFIYSYSLHIRALRARTHTDVEPHHSFHIITVNLFCIWLASPMKCESNEETERERKTGKNETELKSMRIYAIIMNCTFLSGKSQSLCAEIKVHVSIKGCPLILISFNFLFLGSVFLWAFYWILPSFFLLCDMKSDKSRKGVRKEKKHHWI